jgi:RimJ/RimL family protein N-acetyltransferase
VPEVDVVPWGPDDLPLLRAALADPAMMEHLGGPESADKIVARQARYEQPGSRQYKIVERDSGAGVGWVGYWEREWRGGEVYEIGWSVLPAYQGRGIAAAATALVLELARAENRLRFVHAYPSVENAASNTVCRKLGFELFGEVEFEYPKGSVMRCNDWRLALTG